MYKGGGIDVANFELVVSGECIGGSRFDPD